MTTSDQQRRLAALEAAARQDEYAPYATFTAECLGIPETEVLAEARQILAWTEGMTPSEQVRWGAARLGVSVAQLKADMAEGEEQFALWRLKQSTA